MKLRDKGLTSIVPVRLDIPVCMFVFSVILLCAADFDLLETPLRKDRIGCSEVASQIKVLEPDPRSKGMYSLEVFRLASSD
jgi:hypothetical protein